MNWKGYIYLGAAVLALGPEAVAKQTETRLSSSTNATVSGQPVVFSVTVSVTSGSGVPAGVVWLADGGAAIATNTLDGTGQASFSISSLSAGTHQISAIYLRNAGFQSSSSSVISQSVTTASMPPAANYLPVSVTIAQMADGCIRLNLAGGIPGRSCTVQATACLDQPSWMNIATNLLDTNGTCIVNDLASTNYPVRFYRVVSQ